MIEVFSLTCSNTNAALRVGGSDLPADDRTICFNGRASQPKVAEVDAFLADAIENGIEWLVLDSSIEEEHPEFLVLITEADNVPMALASADSPSTMMLKLHNVASKMSGDDPLTDANAIAKRSVQNASDVDSYIAFVRSWSGTKEDPWVLNEFDDFCKYVRGLRDPSADTVRALAAIELGPLVGAHWRLACLKGMASAPARYISATNNIFITESEVRSMSKGKKEFVLQADAHMREARALMALVVCIDQRADIDKARHQMEIRFVAHVMRKVHHMADKTFTSLAEIGCSFHEKLVEIVGKDRAPSLPKVWSKGKSQREKGATTKTVQPTGGTQKRSFQ